MVVTAQKSFDSVTVRPLRPGYQAGVEGQTISLGLSDTDNVSVEPYRLENPLFIFCSKYIPKPENATHVYARGTTTETGTVELSSGDCVYIEEGAVVVGTFAADSAKDIEITGNGIIWGLPLHRREGEPKRRMARMICPIECENVKISGVTIADSPTWNVVPSACKNVAIDNIKIIGIVMSSDGIDVVGCTDVNITHCFICVNDDCLVVKAAHYGDMRAARNVSNVRASDCVLWKLRCGNAIEIGYETSCVDISDIIFEDIDIIHCQYEGWQSGGVFTIHNGDRAHIHDIIYRDIYVEDAEEKLIDIKILSSKYSSDMRRGKISDIIFDRIYVRGDVLPPSIIRGFESELGDPNLVTNVFVRNLFLNGQKVEGRLNAHAIAELSRDIIFE
jgi:polygalacturonase